MREKSSIKVLGTGGDGQWIYVRDVAGDVWAVTHRSLRPDVIAGFARGEWAELAGRFPIRTVGGDPLGWSAEGWRNWIIEQARLAGPIVPRRLPAVRFVPFAPDHGSWIELPPMRAFPTGRLAAANRMEIDLAPGQTGSV